MVKKQRSTPKKQSQEPVAAETYAEFIDNADEVVMDEVGSDDEQVAAVTFTGKRQTVEHITKFKEDAEQGSIKALKKLAGVYKHLLSTHHDEAQLTSAEVYHFGITTSLQSIPVLIKAKLSTDEKREKHWKRCGPVLKSFLTNTIKLLRTTEGTPFVFEKLCPLASSLKLFPVSPKQSLSLAIVKTACKVWGSAERNGKLLVYKFIRAAAKHSAVELGDLYRSLYTNFAKNSKFMSWDRYQAVDLMRSCFIDLLAVDLSEGYQVMFTYLRQLSLHLNTAIKKPTKDRVKTLYNWQYLQSLCLIGQAVTHYSKELGQLQYPLVQVALGLLKLANNLKFSPLRLHILRLLTSLEAAAKTYIPGITPFVLEILQSSELKKRGKPDRLKGVEFLVAIKASKENLKNFVFKEQVVQECCEVLLEHAAVCSTSIAFPEVVLPIRLALKKYCKDLRSPVYKAKLLQVLKQLSDGAVWSENRRIKLGLSPQVAPAFLEGDSPLMGQRKKILDSRAEYINSKIDNLE
jgi:nucleolar complex protein 2